MDWCVKVKGMVPEPREGLQEDLCRLCNGSVYYDTETCELEISFIVSTSELNAAIQKAAARLAIASNSLNTPFRFSNFSLDAIH